MQIAPTIIFFRSAAFRALAYIGSKLFFVKLIAPQFTNPGPDAADWAIEIVLFPVLCYVPWRTEAARNRHAAVSAFSIGSGKKLSIANVNQESATRTTSATFSIDSFPSARVWESVT